MAPSPSAPHLFRVNASSGIRYTQAGNGMLTLTVKVEEGEFAGFYGPRPAFFVPQARSGEGWSVSLREAARRLANTFTRIADGKENIVLTTEGTYDPLSDTNIIDEEQLAELGEQMVGRMFYGKVTQNGDYKNITAFYPLSDPPQGADSPTGSFSIDDL